MLIAVHPVLLHLPLEPLRGSHCQAIQGGAKGFSYPLHTIEGSYLGQHVRGVAALASAHFQIPALPQARQQQVKQEQVALPAQQALAKLDQHRVIKARVAEL